MTVKRAAVLMMSCGVLSGAVPAFAAPVAQRPVRIGGLPDLDACRTVGRVVGLNPRGDNFLAVKAAPDLRAARVDKLGPATEVYICQDIANGKWFGIVYDAGGKLPSRCGVSSPVVPARSYRGPCPSGWVSAKYIEIIAG